MIDHIELAKTMYTAYCAAVGNKAWNGDPLPTWDEFYADETKTKQVEAWLAAADAAIQHMRENAGYTITAHKPLEQWSDRQLLLELFTRGGGPQPAPTKMELYVPHLIKDIMVDKDHTAHIYMPDEDFEVLKDVVGKE